MPQKHTIITFNENRTVRAMQTFFLISINLSNCNQLINKNDNIHKKKFKKSDNQTNIDKYRVATNITEYHVISKLIFLRINIQILINFRQFLHAKKNQQVTVSELLPFLHCN